MLGTGNLAIDFFADVDEKPTADGLFSGYEQTRDSTAEKEYGSKAWVSEPPISGRGKWGQFEEDASGSFAGLTAIGIQRDNQWEEVPDSRHRILLLSKKYASHQLSLSREDHARLEMINQKMDLEYPRFSVRDWEVIQEAEALLSELSDKSGEDAE